MKKFILGLVLLGGMVAGAVVMNVEKAEAQYTGNKCKFDGKGCPKAIMGCTCEESEL